jgi:tetratricopeptide (TPR) repeat protein
MIKPTRRYGRRRKHNPIHITVLVRPDAAPLPMPSENPDAGGGRGDYTPSKEEFDAALEAANKLIRENPGNPDGYNLQGGAYLGKNDYANARKSFERALELRPQSTQVLTNLAQVDLLQQDFAAAKTRYQAILALEPKNVDAMLGMAQAEANSNKEREGLAWLEKAKSANPQALAPRVYLSNYYLLKRKFPEAISEALALQRVNPSSPAGFVIEGDVLVAQQRYNRGSRGVRESLESPAGESNLAQTACGLYKKPATPRRVMQGFRRGLRITPTTRARCSTWRART